MRIEKVSSKFKQLMEKGNLIGALRLLTNNMSNGIWSLSKEILQWLHLKYFEQQVARNAALLQDSIEQVRNVICDGIDEA